MSRCQNKFTERGQKKKKATAAIQKKYLPADKLHLQKTQMCVSKAVISAFDPSLARANPLNKRLYGCIKYLLKDTAFSVENKIQCSHMFIAPATPFSLTINNQTCHPEQTKLGRVRGRGAGGVGGAGSGLENGQRYQEKQALCSHSELASLTPPPLNHLGK